MLADMLANRTSRWSIGAALLCIALLAASWFLLISPRRADATTIRGQAVTADAQAASLQQTITELKAEFADLPKQKTKLKAIKQQLPPKADIPAFVRQLQSLAAQAGVSLQSIVPGQPALAVAAGATTTTTTSTASGPGSLVTIPLTLEVSGDYFEASLFVKNLQTKIQRSYLISGFAVVPAPTVNTTATATATPVASASDAATATPVASAAAAAVSPNLDSVTMTLNGSLFVLLDGTSTLDDVAADAKAAGKTGKATTTPSATSTAAAAASTATTN
jgi:Tfp pilus assembly protein PilO